MAKVAFSKLNLKLNKDVQTVKIGENEIEVIQYLPQEEKAKLVEFVLLNALDERTGCFSPIRIETFFAIAIMKFYTNITFTEKQLSDIVKLYDLLECNGIVTQVMSVIPEEELTFINAAVEDTANDIARYNNSFAGMITNMTTKAEGVDNQFTEIMSKLQDMEGIKELLNLGTEESLAELN